MVMLVAAEKLATRAPYPLATRRRYQSLYPSYSSP
jgi:hypothetical protein